MPVEIASPTRARRGAAPTWDAATATLLWVDTPGCRVHRYDPASGRDGTVELPLAVGAARPRTAGGLACNLDGGVALVDPGGTRRWLAYWSRDGIRCADAAVDPAGRMWAGSGVGPGGWLTVVDPDGAARVAVPDVVSAAGISWSPDGTRMYLVDGPNGRLDAFDYDAAAGAVSKRRPVARFAGAGGLPASACVDADGCLWVSLDGAGAVRRYTPDGRLDRCIEVPTPQVTGCAFGGDRLTDLYLTTAPAPDAAAASAGAADPLAGALLVIPDAGAGLPTTAFAG